MSFLSFYKKNPQDAQTQWQSMSLSKKLSYLRDVGHQVFMDTLEGQPRSQWGQQMMQEVRQQIITHENTVEVAASTNHVIPLMLGRILSTPCTPENEAFIENEFNLWAGGVFKKHLSFFTKKSADANNIRMTKKLLDELTNVEGDLHMSSMIGEHLLHSWEMAQTVLSHPAVLKENTLPSRVGLLMLTFQTGLIERVFSEHKKDLQELLIQHIPLEDFILRSNPRGVASQISIKEGPSQWDKMKVFLLEHFNPPAHMKEDILLCVLKEDTDKFDQLCQKAVLEEEDHVPLLKDVFLCMLQYPCSDAMLTTVLNYLPYTDTKEIASGFSLSPEVFKKMLDIAHPSSKLEELMYGQLMNKSASYDHHLTALAGAVDRHRFVQHVQEKQNNPLSSMLSKLMGSYQGDVIEAFDHYESQSINQDLKKQLCTPDLPSAAQRKM